MVQIEHVDTVPAKEKDLQEIDRANFEVTCQAAIDHSFDFFCTQEEVANRQPALYETDTRRPDQLNNRKILSTYSTSWRRIARIDMVEENCKTSIKTVFVFL